MKKIIFARHEGAKEYLFEVPENLNPCKNDLLFVDTMKGPVLATASSDTLLVEEIAVEEIVKRVGAYLPLKKIITYANKDMRDYLMNEGARRISERVNEAIVRFPVIPMSDTF